VDLSVDVFGKNKERMIGAYQILIFDSRDVEFINGKLEGLCLNNRLLVNIGDSPINNLVSISMPFRISSLFQKISSFIYYSKNNIVTETFGAINFNENTLVKDNTVVQFTEREMELVKKIMAHRISRDELLKSVWNTTVGDNKVVETTVYNIRQKLMGVGADDFIEYSGGYYQIKELK
jgi:hypothetical protein